MAGLQHAEPGERGMAGEAARNQSASTSGGGPSPITNSGTGRPARPDSGAGADAARGF